MQIALVAVVLLAGMWFTVLKPKPADDAVTPAAAVAAPSAEPVAPGVKGLATAVDKAKGAAVASDAANAKVQAATGAPATKAITAKPATAAATKGAKVKAAKPGAAAAKPGTKAATTKAAAAATAAKAKAAATAKAATPATAAKPAAKTDVVDPSERLLAFLAKGKTLVILFEGRGADDKAARRAVHRAAKADPKHLVSAYVPIEKVGDYEAITSGVQILAAPSILVIGADRKATLLSGYVDVRSVEQAVGDARRQAAAAKK
jgi:hypothetical protein